MEFPSCRSQLGTDRLHVLVRVQGKVEDHWFGWEMPSGEPVTFRHDGVIQDEMMMIYNARATGHQWREAWLLDLDPSFPPIGNRPPKISDYGYAHDVCAGLGGFSSACSYLGVEVLSAVDCSPLAVQAFGLNHDCPVWCDQIENVETLYRMHTIQHQRNAQAILMATILQTGAQTRPCRLQK